MADLTTLSTFTQTVMGNRRVVYADVPGGNSTADTIVFPMTRVFHAVACYRGSTAGSSAAQICTVDGTTVSIFTPAATTAVSLTVRAEGR